MRFDKLMLLFKMEMKKDLLNGTIKKKKATKLWGLILGFIILEFYVILGSVAGSKNPDLTMKIFSFLTVLMILVGVFMTGLTSLFGQSEINILVPLPFSNKELVWSKLLGLLVSNFITVLTFMAFPIIYIFIVKGHNVVGGILGLVTLIFFHWIPLVVSFLIATIFGKYVKFKYKSQVLSGLLGVILVIVYLGIYVFKKALATSLPLLIEKFQIAAKILTPQNILFQKILLQASFASFFIFIAISIVIAGFIMTYVAKNYFAIYENLKSGGSKSSKKERAYKNKGYKAESKFMANYKKEWRLYLSYPVYFSNTIIPSFAVLAGGIVIWLVDAKGIDAMAGYNLSNILANYGIFIATWLGSSSATTYAAFSVEGKNAWIPYTAPLSTLDIALPKIFMSLSISILPLVIFISGLIVKFKVPYKLLPFYILLPLSFMLLNTLFSAILDFKFAKYDWINVTEIVKQRFAMILSLLATIIPAAIGIGIYYCTKSLFATMFGLALVIILADIVCFLYIKRYKIYTN